MVAQLLAQRGVVSRRVPHALASREMIGQLDLSAVEAVIVSYLELTESPARSVTDPPLRQRARTRR